MAIMGVIAAAMIALSFALGRVTRRGGQIAYSRGLSETLSPCRVVQ